MDNLQERLNADLNQVIFKTKISPMLLTQPYARSHNLCKFYLHNTYLYHLELIRLHGALESVRFSF